MGEKLNKRKLIINKSIFFKIIIIIIFVFFTNYVLSNNSLASTCEEHGTDVFGPIFENTTWTKEGSPYCIIQNVNILKNVTLTIEPDVIVKFYEGTDQAQDKKYSIIIEGQLIAVGSEDERIIFTSYKEEPKSGDWNSLEFTSTAIAATYDEHNQYVSGCILEFVTIEYGGGSGQYTVLAKNSPYLNHVIFQKNIQQGIYLGTCTIVENSTFNDNTMVSSGAAIYADDAITVKNSKFINNSTINSRNLYGGAIYCSRSLIVINSIFYNNSANATFDRSSYGGAIYSAGALTIVNSDFSNNSSIARKYSHGGAIYCSNDILIKDSNFKNNSTYSYHSLSYGGAILSDSFLSVTNTVFTNNYSFSRNSTRGGAIYANNLRVIGSKFNNNFTESERDNTFGGAIYSNNTLTSLSCEFIANSSIGNTSYAGAIYGLNSYIIESSFIDNVSDYSTIYSDMLSLTNCIVYKNNCEYAVYLESGIITKSTITNNSNNGILIGSGNDSPPDIYMNNIFGHEPYDIENKSSIDICATFNYWGTTDLSTIFLNIFDRFDDQSIGEVNIGRSDNTYLTEVNTQAPAIPALISENYTFNDTMVGLSNLIAYTLSNATENNLSVTQISITGADASHFIISYENCTDRSVLPETSCFFEIRFLPKSKGIKNAVLIIETDNALTDSILALKGAGYIFTISGKVETYFAGHSNLSVIGATVMIEGTSYSTATNNEGCFSLELGVDIQTGKYILTVLSPNFTTKRMEVSLIKGKSIEIEPLTIAPKDGGVSCDINGNGLLDLGDIIHNLQTLCQ